MPTVVFFTTTPLRPPLTAITSSAKFVELARISTPTGSPLVVMVHVAVADTDEFQPAYLVTSNARLLMSAWL